MAYKTILRVLSLMLAFVILLFCFAACSDKKEEEETTAAPIIGDFVPPPFDETAEVGKPTVPDPKEMGYTSFDAHAFKVTICCEITFSGNNADLYFTNPEENNVWLKLRVINASGEVVAETGLIRPGEYIKTVRFSKIPSSGEKITLKAMAYEPQSYYSVGAAPITTIVR